MKLVSMIFAAGMALMATVALAADMPAGPYISTMGSATIDVVPDMATLQIDVTVSAKDAVTAKKKIDERVAQYLYFLQKQGVDKKDIASANLRTQPEYDYRKNGERVLKGYQAIRAVEVKVLKLDHLSTILDGALQAGLNEINRVELGVAKPELYRAEVRKKAIANAIAQARDLAEGFGAKLGPVYSISYRTNSAPPAVGRIMMAMPEASSDAAGAETYQQKNITFSDQVDVVFDLDR
ncbi:MAG: oxidative stress defense protein [Enterobacteriaceae bacterium]